MANKKNKKRLHSRTVELKRQMEQEKLADEKDRTKNRMDPTARVLLYADLIFLAAASLLYANHLISDFVSSCCTIFGVILLLIALWFQFWKPKKGGGLGQGPRL